MEPDNETEAVVYVTKLAAARRQLSAAIKMFFSCEDALAVHTVAHAAYRVLSDLKGQRGRDEASDAYLRAIFYVVRDYRRGTLPKPLLDDPSALLWIEGMARELPITSSSTIDEIELRLPPGLVREYWARRNAISNFLKHADKDSDKHLHLDSVDNHHLVLSALAAYLDVARELPPEGMVFWVYSCVQAKNKSPISPPLALAAEALEKLEASEQMAFCSEWIRRLQANPFKEADWVST